MIKVVSEQEAARMIPDGVCVGITGFAGTAHAEKISAAIEERFLSEGNPKNLTLFFSAGVGDGKDRGTTHYAHDGLVKRVIGGHWGLAPKLVKLVNENKIEAYNLPQGTLAQLVRDIAAGKPGTLSKVGLNTFVDPRIEGGKLNTVTKEDLVNVTEIMGEEYLFYKRFNIDIAIIRATSADERGNLSIEKEAIATEILSMAQAAKNAGGLVIAQVERLVSKGSIHPKSVKVPGILVDAVVVVPNQCQTYGESYNPAYSGEVRVPLNQETSLPFDIRKIIGRRAALELTPKAIINLGIGMPEWVAQVAHEEGISNDITLTIDIGGVGGIPDYGMNFGATINPDAIIDHAYQFDFYDGGGLDIAFLGLAQVDKTGNINVSKFGSKIAGCGGFINITQNAKKVIFCGSFTTSGLDIRTENGELKILNEGSLKKFVNKVEQITFSGDYANKKGQPVLYITERAVFELQKNGLVLTEIAPGVDLEKDIVQQMNFKPIISANLKEMDKRIFQEEKMGIYF